MKKILVTGSNGLLGQKLTDKLRNRTDVQLLATSIGENRYPMNEGFEYASLDITDQQQVNKVIGDFAPDVVIHSAAMTNVDACENEREKCWKLNVDATGYLMQAASKVNAHFIYLSTDFIFDGENGPYAESDKASPLSYYGESKLEAEKMVECYDGTWAIVRTILVFGVVADMSRSNIVLWAKGALEKNQEINVVNDQFRMPTLAEDLADACILIGEKRAEGVYHISGKDYMSVVDLVRRIARHYKLDENLISEISSEKLNQAAKRPPKTGFVLDKAYELGYKPHSFEEGLSMVKAQLQ